MSEERLFTQGEVNEIIRDRLAREKRSQARELEEIRTEAETGEPDFKQQYDDNKATYIDLLKKTKLLDAGVKLDSLDDVVWLIKGESEEEIDASIAEIAPNISPAYLKGGEKAGSPKPYADPSGKKKGVWNPFSK